MLIRPISSSCSRPSSRGITSPGVAGTLTRDQALARLLAGTGMSYRFTSPDTVTIERPDPLKDLVNKAKQPLRVAEDETTQAAPKKTGQDQPTVLEDMTVTASPGDRTRYNVPNATTATKTDTPIFDTPVSIQVVPREVLDVQQAFRLEDTYRNVSGVYALPFVSHFSDDFVIRGFRADRTAFRDGFRIRGPSFNLTNIEQVEVLKGPVGMLYGRLDPGGLINVTTKRPLVAPYYSLQQQFGSYDTYRTTLDATGPVIEDGSLLYRLNFEYLNEDSFADFVFGDRKFVAPSLTWHLSENTQIDFDYTYQDYTLRPFEGIPIINGKPADLPRNRFLGEPTDRSDDVFHEGAVTITHAFNADWKARGRFSIFEQEVLFQGTDPVVFDETSGLLQRSLSHFDDQRSHLFGTLDLTGSFNTWGLQHTLLFGGDYYETEFDEVAIGGVLPTPIDVNNPRYGQDDFRPILAEGINTPFVGHNGGDWWGIYIQDQIKFADQWHFLMGTRYDASHADSRFDFGDGSVFAVDVEDEEFSYRFGLLYHPLSWLAIFGSYVDAFTNSNEFAVVANNAAPEPERGEQFEAGLKGQWWDSRLSASLVYFHLEKQNIPVPHSDPVLAGRGLNELAGVARSQGVELDIQGQVTDFWKLIANYTYTDAEITEDRDASGGPGKQGNRLIGVPRHGGNLWSEHDLTALGLAGFSAAWGFRFVGERMGDDNNTFRLPGYGLLDLALSYTQRLGSSKVTARLNIDNVLDKEYHQTSSLSFFRFAVPGDPLTFMGSIRVEF